MISKEQKAILKYLVNIPPIEYLKKCNTKDRIDHWIKLKIIYLLLHDFLKNHFNGTPLPVELPSIPLDLVDQTNNLVIGLVISKETDKKDKVDIFQYTTLTFEYYLKLYAVFSWGWKYMAPEFEKLKEKNKDYRPPKNPGEALIRVIKDFFMGDFSTLFPESVTGNFYREFSPRKAYKIRGDKAKINHLKQKKGTLTPKEKTQIDQYDREIKKQQEMAKPFLISLKLYLSFCLNHESEDKTMQGRLKELATSAGALESYIYHHWHPRQQPQGYAINRGVLEKGRKKGGIYRS